jgi:multidrug efflux pump subunit AcrA (membrane-fusion protein)
MIQQIKNMLKNIVFLFPLILLACNPSNKRESIKPALTDITESVYASVRLKPKHSYFPQPTRSGIIKEIFVEAGDSVTSGQLLVRISASADAKNTLTNAEVAFKEAEENYQGDNNLLLNMDLELNSLKDQLVKDSLNYHRQKKLWDQQIGKKSDLERYELTFENTKNQYAILQKKRAQTLLNLENQYTKTRSKLNAERSQMEEFTLRSNLSGIVFAIFKQEGELINSQEQFAEIGSANNFVIEMDIDEDITKIEIGDTVAITLNAYANEVFLAQVTKVLPKKDETTQTFRVESSFLQPPPKLYNGLSGEASIIVDQRKNTMVIPSEYLGQGNKVLTEQGEKNVTIGVRNMDFVEILSGLDTSSLLLIPNE